MDSQNWEGRIEEIDMEYEFSSLERVVNTTTSFDSDEILSENTEIKADKVDCLVAVSSGTLISAIDILWVGEFSLRYSQDIGTDQINKLVISVSKKMGCMKNELKDCIQFLEKKYPMASDKLIKEFGGGLQHHLRDFSHHASPFGLICSILNQFVGKGYGTDIKGNFITPDLSETDLLGKTFEEKILLGVIHWFFHLISDMAGSSSNVDRSRGTGIPGPLLSFAKVLSSMDLFKDLKIKYINDEIGFSVWISKIFNGTAFEHTNTKDLIHFDLRTEVGIINFGLKQAVPVIINQCIVRGFYFIRHLAQEYSAKAISSILDLARIDPNRILPFNNRCITRMITLSTGTFSIIDSADAFVRAKVSSSNNDKMLLANVLLCVNFIGVGTFALSIKNEMKYTIHDAKKLLNSEFRAGKLMEKYENFIQNIDIEADMDNSGLYDYAFNCMYNHVKKNKDVMSRAQEVMQSMHRSIFTMTDSNTELYNKITKKSMHSLMIEVQNLIMRLFTLNSVPYKRFGDGEEFKYMPFMRKEEGKQIAYIFSYRIAERLSDWERLRDQYNLDGIKVVSLIELKENKSAFYSIVRHESLKTEEFVRYTTIKEVFNLLGNGEFEVFKNYTHQFNDSIKELIGYSTITIPFKDMLVAFKKTTLDRIKGIDYSSYLFNIDTEQTKILNNNYIKCERYRIIIGNSDFAESFLSSEWYYSMHVATSRLEQTAIVVGYLKSVEQLLYKIVKLSINTGKTIKKIGSKEFIDYTDSNEAEVDTSLGSLIGYVKYYSDLWDVNRSMKYYITDKLNEYRIKYRNDHFHKNNVYDLENIREIREQTMLMYYLLLGAFSIASNQITDYEMYMEFEEVKESLKYEEFESWLNRMLGGDSLLSDDIPVYFLFKSYGQDSWELQFNTVSGFNDKCLPENMQYPYISDSLYWPRVLEENEAEAEVIWFAKHYLESGKYADKLKKHSLIAAGRMFDHQIIYIKKSI